MTERMTDRISRRVVTHQLRAVAALGQFDHPAAWRLRGVVLAQAFAQTPRLHAHDAVAPRVKAVRRALEDFDADHGLFQHRGAAGLRVFHQVAQQALMGLRARKQRRSHHAGEFMRQGAVRFRGDVAGGVG